MNDEPGLGGILVLILPDFGALFSGGVEAVTPVLVLIIGGLAIGVGGFAWREAQRAIHLLTESAGPVDGVTQEDLWARRTEIVEKAKACSPPVADTWRELNETLVSDGRQLFNTVEAAEFFNEHRFAPRLVGNRLLQAAPTVLTMLGLLGTFIGLTVGLRGLDLGSSADELRGGIQTLVHGASLGFTASLWGVAMSLVTNVFERWQERRVVRRAQALQSQIDHLFRMRSPEQSLSDIAASSKDSNTALQVLHEKIGSALQESVKGVGEETGRAVTLAIQEALAPVMSDLAKSAADQSADVFKEISGQLTESFREIGTSLAGELKASSDSMRSTLEYMGEQLARQADEHLAHMTELRRTTTEQITAMTEATSRQVDLLDRSLPPVVSGLERASSLVGDVMTGMDAATANLRAVATDLGNVSTGLGAMLSSAIGTMTELSAKTLEAARALDDQRGAVGELTERSVVAARHLTEASETLNGGFVGMRSAQQAFLEDLQQQLTKHSAAMSGWLATYGAQVNQQTAHRMSEWNAHTEAFTNHMLQATSALSDAIDELGTPRAVEQGTAA